MRFTAYFVSFCLCFCSCASKKAVIKQVHAYASVHLPGIVLKDEQGNEQPGKIDSSIVIYVESASKDIVWDSAWSNTQPFSVSSYAFSERTLEIGTLKDSQEKVVLSVQPANYLIRLSLQPVEVNNYQAPANLGVKELLFRGVYKGKAIVWKTSSAKELETLPAY